MKSDIRALDLNLLKALDALLSEGSVTRAALRLSLTQPAVSGMLTRLRDYFGDPLFVRTSHGMVPTLRAIELSAPLKQILTDIAIMLEPIEFEPLTAEMTYTIAATDYALKVIIIPLIAALKQLAPHINVAVRSLDSGRLYQQLACGDIDLAFVTPQTAPDDLHARALYEEKYVCVTNSHHPLTAASKMTIKDFCEQEHILVSTEGSFAGVTDEVLAGLKLKRRVSISVNSFLVVPDILRTNSMIAVIPSRLVPADSDLITLPLPLKIPGFIKSMVWHERTHRDAAHQWIRALCVKVSQQQPIVI
ncbi:transcriptional regulator [Pantoea agglomerans]|nr:LysR family transcriptional regulator [Pantoea agglomerans]PEI02891.1 transcriptional regulator [Pantoea agglomerans]